MSFSASWLMLAIMLVRILFRGAPKWLFPALWGLVGLRLLLPETLESSLSLIPERPVKMAVQTANPAGENSLISYMSAVWCLGIAVMLLYEAVRYFRLRRRLKTAVRLHGNIYQSEYAKIPFVTGLFAPRIYIPFHMDQQEFDSVIAHERAHIKRGDHWRRAIAYIILSIYWFHPLIWAAYFLLCRDIERACDEYAVRMMNHSQRAAYAKAVLSYAADRRTNPASPVAFSDRDLKRRICAVLDCGRPSFRTIAIAAVLIPLLGVCFLTDPKQPSADSLLAQQEQMILADGKADSQRIKEEAALLQDLMQDVLEEMGRSLR